jgi:hypothetical protein
MGSTDGRFAVATIRHLLHNTQALVVCSGAMRALMVEPKIGGVRRASKQHNQARCQKYGYCSHQSHSTEFPGTLAAKTKRPFSGRALFMNAVKFLRIS